MSIQKSREESAVKARSKANDPEYQRAYRKRRTLEDPAWMARAAAKRRREHPESIKAAKHRYYERHKERLKAQTKANRTKRAEYYRAYNREYQRQRSQHLSEARRHRRYGLTLGQIEALLTAQNHQCAICARAKPTIKKLCVDHCHSTHTVRGILCDSCNRGLGAFHDNADWLLAAVAYLRRFPIAHTP